MKTINYLSDFKLVIGFRDGTSITTPFKFTFYTKVSRGTYVAEFDGTEYINCYPTDDGRVKISFDNHNLGMGVLRGKIQFFLQDYDLNDGKYNYVSDESMNIVLDKGATDAFNDVEELMTNRIVEVFIEKPYVRVGGGEGVEIPNGSITESKLANSSVSVSKIQNGAVTTAKVAEKAITEDKLSDSVREKLNNQGGGSGEKGEDGKSAYEIWLDQGNEGSEQDFLDSLKGEKGEQGEQGEKGADGEKGEQGIKGEKGEKGDKMSYDDFTEEEKNDLASRVEVPAPEVDLSEYAKKSDVPTKTSELTNDSGYVTATKVVAQSASVATIQPNVLNVWGEVASLDITLAEPTDNTIVNEYMAQFTSGETATTLKLPRDVKWMAAPNIQPNKTYQLSVINNLGVIGEFNHE